MRKLISFLLASIMLFSNAVSFAAPGDFINTGNKKYYNMRSTTGKSDFIKDLKDSNINNDKIYREVNDGSYVNVSIEEIEQNTILEKFLKDNNIDALQIDKYLKDPKNSSKVVELQNKINASTKALTQSFESIKDDNKGNIDEYDGNNTYAPKLGNPENYSTPVPGSNENTTKIMDLKSYSGSTKWMYKVEKTNIDLPKKDGIVTGTVYVQGDNITVKEGESILLYATDLNNKVKAYDVINIKSNMIQKPRVPAKLITDGTMIKGNTVANAINISGVKGTKWKCFITSDKLENIFVDDNFKDAINFTNDTDIVVETDSTLIDDNFKRFIYLINIDGDKISEYILKEINKNNLSQLPDKLVKDTNYVGPTPATGEGTTSFTKLTLDKTGTVTWKVKVGDDSSLPVAGGKLEGTDFKSYTTNGNIKAEIGQKLILIGLVNDKVSHYAIFDLKEENISGEKPLAFVPKFKAVKGNKSEHTMVVDIIMPKGATKFMYAVGDKMAEPFLGRLYEGSKDYTLGEDIEAKVGDKLFIFATDDNGRVKVSDSIILDKSMIKDPLAHKLFETTNYESLIKGTIVGSTRFPYLEYDDVKTWKYMVSDKPFNTPELESKPHSEAKDITVTQTKSNDIMIETDSNLLKADSFYKHMMVVGLDEKGNILACGMFEINEKVIKLPDADLLKIDTNYSSPTKGKRDNSTKFETLKFTSLIDATEFKYKIVNKNENTKVEFNEVVKDVKTLEQNREISPVLPEERLLVLATNKSNKTKAYAYIDLKEINVKTIAPFLDLYTNYELPIPGEGFDSTKFEDLILPDDATKWIVKGSESSHGDIDLNSIIKDAFNKDYKKGADIPNVFVNDYLLLVATDTDGKVKAYKEFKLNDKQVRGSKAEILVESRNYKSSKGEDPSTTKITDLKFNGLKQPLPTRWKVKWVENESYVPFIGEIIENASFYKDGDDIHVKSINGGYGFVLLMATDSSGRTRAYKHILLNVNNVKEHAPIIKDTSGKDLTLKKGDSVDTTNFKDLPDKEYKYSINDNEPTTPAKGSKLPNNVIDYDKKDVSIKIGHWLSLYSVDENENIIGFSSFKITSDDLKQVNVELKGGPFTERDIVKGGSILTIILKDGAKWKDFENNESILEELFNKFTADKETSEWSKVISSLIRDGIGAINLKDNNSILEIFLPETPGYDIKVKQKINLTVPYKAIDGALNPVEASGNISINPIVSATISGDVVNSIVRQADLEAGGKTIVVELMDGDWATDVSKIMEHFISNAGPSSNWSKIAAAVEKNDINRDSAKKVTITLPQITGLAFGTTQETISFMIEKDKNNGLVKNTTENIVANPNFILYANRIEIKGTDNDDPIILVAPDYKTVGEKNNTWIINMTAGTLKENITDKDIDIKGLPNGLKSSVSKVGENQLQIKLTGTASSPLTDALIVKVNIKGTAVNEPNSIDSKDIELKLIKGTSILEELGKVKVDVVGKKLLNDTSELNNEKMEFSLDSKNGIDGKAWKPAISENTKEIEFKAGKVFVRDKDNPKVFKEVATLSHDKAPLEINAYEKKVVYSTSGKEVELTGLKAGTSYDYSIDGGKVWYQVPTSNKVTLKNDSDLRVRHSSNKDTLYSLSTTKLNGLYIGNVTMNVADGSLIGTTTGMEYSLNDGATYTTAKANITPVTFIKISKVVIREKAKPMNSKSLNKDEIGIEGSIDITDIDYHIGDGTITNKTLRPLEYRFNNDKWINLETPKQSGESSITPNINFVPGSLQFRAKGTEANLPSPSVSKNIKIRSFAPELKYDDTNYEIEKIGYKIDDSEVHPYEYSINGGIWTFGDTNTQFEGGNTILVRLKATKDALPSMEQKIIFIKNLDLYNVILNAGKSQLENTSNLMEYSITGKDGQWFPCTASTTNLVGLKNNSEVYVREKIKPKNYWSVKESPLKKKNFDSKPSFIQYNLKFDILQQTISVQDIDSNNKDIIQDLINNLQYRIGTGLWVNVDYVILEPGSNIIAHKVNFIPGNLEFRLKGDVNNLPSDSVFKATIQAPTAKPNVSIGFDVIEYRNKVADNTTGLEYGFSTNGPWTDATNLDDGKNLDNDNLVRNIYIRTKATKDKLPSLIETLNFTPVLNLKVVTFSDHTQPLELNGTTTDMKYMINNSGTWLPCSNGNTQLKRMDGTTDLNDETLIKTIEIYDIKQPLNKFTVLKKQP